MQTIEGSYERLNRTQFNGLKVGDQIILIAGQHGMRQVARVTVSQEPGTTGVFVKIDEWLEKGDKVPNEAPYRVGDEILAGTQEVYRKN